MLKKKCCRNAYGVSVLPGGRLDEECTDLVQAHDLDDPRFEVEDLFVPYAHSCLLQTCKGESSQSEVTQERTYVYRSPVHDVGLERLVHLLDDAVRDRLPTQVSTLH